MLEDTDCVEVIHDKHKYEVYTVKHLLEMSLRVAQLRQEDELMSQLEIMLTGLPDFRNK